VGKANRQRRATGDNSRHPPSLVLVSPRLLGTWDRASIQRGVRGDAGGGNCQKPLDINTWHCISLCHRSHCASFPQLATTIYLTFNMPSIYPTFEDLKPAKHGEIRVVGSIDLYRLHWFLRSDDLASSISVLEDPKDPNSAQTPYSSTHPVSQCALTNPPVSAITVSTDVLDDYSVDWTYTHNMHAEPEDSPDHDGERFDEEGRVEHCCQQDRPGPGPQIEVIAAPGEFVTIGLFIEVVHPWLRGLDDALRAGQGVVSCWPLDPAIEMYVWPRLGQLGILTGEGKKSSNWVYQWESLAKLAMHTQRRNDDAKVMSEQAEVSALLDGYHVV
jgi:hypothetical protein